MSDISLGVQLHLFSDLNHILFQISLSLRANHDRIQNEINLFVIFNLLYLEQFFYLIQDGYYVFLLMYLLLLYTDSPAVGLFLNFLYPTPMPSSFGLGHTPSSSLTCL
jgi:hypothetical protein